MNVCSADFAEFAESGTGAAEQRKSLDAGNLRLDNWDMPSHRFKSQNVSSRVRLLSLFSLLALVLGGSLTLRAQAQRSHYVVRLRSEPALAHDGSARAVLAGGETQTARAVAMKAYLTALRDEHASVREWIASRHSGTVLAETDLTFNALIVEMTAADADALSQQPDVAEIYPELLYHKTMDAALQLVRAPEAWAARTGGEAGAGEGVKIGIIDTGFDITHPMLQDPALVAPAGFPKFSQSVDSFCLSDDQKYTNNKVKIGRAHV